MNARELAELTALIERIDDLLKQYDKETSLERIAALQAELTEATGKLKRVALSLSKLSMRVLAARNLGAPVFGGPGASRRPFSPAGFLGNSGPAVALKVQWPKAIG